MPKKIYAWNLYINNEFQKPRQNSEWQASILAGKKFESLEEFAEYAIRRWDYDDGLVTVFYETEA